MQFAGDNNNNGSFTLMQNQLRIPVSKVPFLGIPLRFSWLRSPESGYWEWLLIDIFSFLLQLQHRLMFSLLQHCVFPFGCIDCPFPSDDENNLSFCLSFSGIDDENTFWLSFSFLFFPFVFPFVFPFAALTRITYDCHFVSLFTALMTRPRTLLNTMKKDLVSPLEPCQLYCSHP